MTLQSPASPPEPPSGLQLISVKAKSVKIAFTSGILAVLYLLQLSLGWCAVF